MKISYFSIGHVSFVADEETYIAEVTFQTKGDDRLTGSQKIYSHDINLRIRKKGDRSWSFERIQAEILAEAVVLLGLAHEHIDGATIESLEQYNAAIDKENEEERSTDLQETLSKSFQ